MRFAERLFVAIFMCLAMHAASLGSADAAVDRVDCRMEAVSTPLAGDIVADDVHATRGDECRDGECNTFTCHCFCHGGVTAALTVAMPVLPSSERAAVEPLGLPPSLPVHILPPTRPPQA